MFAEIGLILLPKRKPCKIISHVSNQNHYFLLLQQFMGENCNLYIQFQYRKESGGECKKESFKLVSVLINEQIM